MQPTMVVSPGQPPPGMEQFQGGGFGAPPPAGPPQQPPKKKSRIGLFIGLGCLAFILIGGLVGGIGGYMACKAIMPGTEIATTDAQVGAPFTLTYTQSGSQQYEVWLDLDVAYSNGLSLTGPINISRAGQVIGQYNLELTGSGSPIRERSSSKRVNWVSTNVGGNGSTHGKTFLFSLPPYEDGETITISGTVTAAPGVTVNRLRFFVTD